MSAGLSERTTMTNQAECFSILGWIDWCLLGNILLHRHARPLWFQYPRVDRLVSAGPCQPGSAGADPRVSVSSGGSIGVCWSPVCSCNLTRAASFSILGWIDWCLLAEWDHSKPYPAGVSVSSGGSIGVCWFVLRLPRSWTTCFSILGWIDWCLLVIGERLYPLTLPQFQYPRVDRLVSAGW